MSPLKLNAPRKLRRSCSRWLGLQFAQRAESADQADHVLQRRVVGSQHIQFLLRKVADVQALCLR